MATKGVIEVDGEIYCLDLEKMLSDPNCPKTYLLAVRRWLEKVQQKRKLNDDSYHG